MSLLFALSASNDHHARVEQKCCCFWCSNADNASCKSLWIVFRVACLVGDLYKIKLAAEVHRCDDVSQCWNVPTGCFHASTAIHSVELGHSRSVLVCHYVMRDITAMCESYKHNRKLPQRSQDHLSPRMQHLCIMCCKRAWSTCRYVAISEWNIH